MPLYQYVCQKCDNDFEELVSAGDEIECPKCQSKKLERQTSLPGMPVVKGSAASSCGDLSLPPCGAQGCRRTGRG